MKVKVRIYAALRRYVPDVPLGQSTVLDLPPGATVGDALDQLGIPREETKVCFVVGVRRDLDYCLRDDDEVAIFPPVAGGSAHARSRAESVTGPSTRGRGRPKSLRPARPVRSCQSTG